MHTANITINVAELINVYNNLEFQIREGNIPSGEICSHERDGKIYVTSSDLEKLKAAVELVCQGVSYAVRYIDIEAQVAAQREFAASNFKRLFGTGEQFKAPSAEQQLRQTRGAMERDD
ncbi:MAG: hypothetical protein WCA35_09910 [Kovacikia sp.]